MEIRPYKKEDAAEVVNLFYETVRSVNRADYSQQQVKAWAPEIPDPEAWHTRMVACTTLVAEQEGEVVGFAELEEDGHLDMFYLRRDFIGRGIGYRLYEAVERKARVLDVGRIFTEASVTARPFFMRRGFRVLREQIVQHRGVGLKNYVMEKQLER